MKYANTKEIRIIPSENQIDIWHINTDDEKMLFASVFAIDQRSLNSETLKYLIDIIVEESDLKELGIKKYIEVNL